MSRVAIVFSLFHLILISIAALAYFGLIPKSLAGMIEFPLLFGYIYHRLVGRKEPGMNMIKILEGQKEE